MCYIIYSYINHTGISETRGNGFEEEWGGIYTRVRREKGEGRNVVKL